MLSSETKSLSKNKDEPTESPKLHHGHLQRKKKISLAPISTRYQQLTLFSCLWSLLLVIPSETGTMDTSNNSDHQEGENEYYDANDVEQEVLKDNQDLPMEEDGEEDDGQEDATQEEIALQNDSSAHFDQHSDSIFCIAQHPIHSAIVVTGSGDDTAYVFNSTPTERPPLPHSFETNSDSRQPPQAGERASLPAISKLDGHSDSVNTVAFSQPNGEYVLTGGLDGKLRTWRDSSSQKDGTQWSFVAEAAEVEEVGWIAPCPVPRTGGDVENVNIVAIGGSGENDGSVWVYRIDAQDVEQPLVLVGSFFMHTGPCTAGAWSPDGKLLATVSEDGCFYVYDVFGAAAAAGFDVTPGQTVVSKTNDDARFAVEGGFYSVAIAPNGSFAALGGAGGFVKIIGLPIVSSSSIPSKSKGKAKGGAPASAGTGSGAAGSLLASLQVQSDGVETLSFSSSAFNLLITGSVDGSIAIFDITHRFALRRHIREAHGESAVVKVEFVQDPSPGPNNKSHLFTSVGIDGVTKRWDARGGTAAAQLGFLKEWKGHLGLIENGEGEQSGGILGFVQTPSRIVTAGDDGVSLVFED